MVLKQKILFNLFGQYLAQCEEIYEKQHTFSLISILFDVKYELLTTLQWDKSAPFIVPVVPFEYKLIIFWSFFTIFKHFSDDLHTYRCELYITHIVNVSICIHLIEFFLIFTCTHRYNICPSVSSSGKIKLPNSWLNYTRIMI